MRVLLARLRERVQSQGNSESVFSAERGHLLEVEAVAGVPFLAIAAKAGPKILVPLTAVASLEVAEDDPERPSADDKVVDLKKARTR